MFILFNISLLCVSDDIKPKLEDGVMPPSNHIGKSFFPILNSNPVAHSAAKFGPEQAIFIPYQRPKATVCLSVGLCQYCIITVCRLCWSLTVLVLSPVETVMALIHVALFYLVFLSFKYQFQHIRDFFSSKDIFF